MNILDLISLLENRLATLNQNKATFIRLGDVAALAAVEAEIAQTEATIAQLETLD